MYCCQLKYQYIRQNRHQAQVLKKLHTIYQLEGFHLRLHFYLTPATC